jgi:hypothetical protein
MFCKALAILLVGSWVFLSAIDMLEDLDLANNLKIHASERSDFAGFGRAAHFANNVVENGTRHIVTPETGLFIPRAGDNLGLELREKEVKTRKNNLKIYKLHSTFLN